ncbi:MAG: sugar-binding protein [Candidatus Omnitrophota bacterium]
MNKKITFLTCLVLLTVPNVYSQPLGIFTDQTGIGDEGMGAASFANGVYKIEASGSDIWNNADGCYYVYKEVEGAFIIEGDLEWGDQIIPGGGPDAGNDWKKLGFMVREDPNAAGSRHVTAILRKDYGSDVQFRETKDGASGETPGLTAKGAADTNTIRLMRVFNGFTMMRKQTDGSYKTIGSKQMDLPAKVKLGLAVTGHDTAALETGIFKNVTITSIPVSIEVARSSSQTTFLPGVPVPGIKLTVTIETGKTADVTVTETLPVGWTINKTTPTTGVTVAGNILTWKLTGASGSKTLTYDLKPAADAGEGVILSGTAADASGNIFGIIGFASLDLEGASTAKAPMITTNKVTLDGNISAGEYEGAYLFKFDRANAVAPGVLISGPSYTPEQSSLTIRVFHDADNIYVAMDMVDPLVDYTSSANVWECDGVELYLDGDYSKSNPKDANMFGFQATVIGNGVRTAGNDPPTPVELPGGGYASDDGQYWNFGAKGKADNSGFIVEYKVDKNMVLDPLTIKIVGFDIGVNDASNTGVRTGKWAWWHFDMDTGLRKDSWNDERGWGTLELLSGALPPPVNVSDWSLF